jgi:hypothetical protein
LFQISGEGEPLRVDAIADKLSGWSGIAGDQPRGNNRVVSLAGAGNDVAIIAYDKKNRVSRIWRYDRQSQTASIAYRG